MQRLILFAVLVGLTARPVVAQTVYKMGLTFDEAAYEKVPVKAILTKGNFDKLAPRVSYEAFCPPVMSQDNYNTCVAFATTYYLRTMLEAIRRQRSGRPNRQGAFSPSYIYEKIKTTPDLNCKAGSRLPDALFALKTYGALQYETLPYPSCDDPGTKLDAEAAPHKIGDVIRLFGKGANPVQKVQCIKKALSEGYPIVIGMHTPLSFFATREVWEPAPGDALIKEFGGHALCVIGYDDAKFGGAFRVVNSWGAAWADGGFCWIRYNDLARFTPYAFQAFPALEPPALATADQLLPAPVGMQASIDFQLQNGQLMGFHPLFRKPLGGEEAADGRINSLMTYRMARAYPSGAAFKLLVTNAQQAYVYLIGTDSTYRMTRLFPFDEAVSPLLGPHTTMAYPSEYKSIMLDGSKGTDYILVLFSRKRLDYSQLADQLQRASGNLADRVASVLKSNLIDRRSIRYRADGVGFMVDGTGPGTVVPVLVALEHK